MKENVFYSKGIVQLQPCCNLAHGPGVLDFGYTLELCVAFETWTAQACLTPDQQNQNH